MQTVEGSDDGDDNGNDEDSSSGPADHVEEEHDSEGMEQDKGKDLIGEKSPLLLDRTMECFVCGKLFPRGPIDLARHQNGTALLILPRAIFGICTTFDLIFYVT